MSLRALVAMSILRRVVLLSRILGLAPYGLSSSGDFSQSTICRACSLIGVSAMGGVSVVLYHFARVDINGGYAVAEAIATSITAVEVAVFCGSLWWRQYPELWHILNYPDVRHAARKASVVPALSVMLSCAGGIALGMVLFQLNNQDYGWIRNSTLSLVVWILIATGDMALFAYLLTCAAERFGDLNSDMRTMVAQNKASVVPVAPSSPVASSLLRVRSKHKEMTDLVQRMSRCFGLQVLLELLLTFWWCVTLMFTTAVTRSKPIIHKLPLLSLVAGYGTSKSCLILTADRTVSKGNEVLDTIHAFLNVKKLTDNEKQELQAFSLQIFHRPVVVSLAGIIQLNTRLLFQAGAAATTYMIILLQFQSSEVWGNVGVPRSSGNTNCTTHHGM